MPPLKKIMLLLFVGAMVATVTTPALGRWFALQLTQLKSVLKPVVSICGLCFWHAFKEGEY